MAVETAKLAIKARNERGSRANKRLRDAGQVPGVIYGHKEAVLSVAMDRRELGQHLAHGAHVFELSLDGKAETVLVKDIQYDHLGTTVIHIDFNRVSVHERVKVTVPLELKGKPKGEEDGGVLQQIIADLDIECPVLEIPDAIRHNVADMALNDVLHIKDLKAPGSIKFLQDGELIVAMVKEVQEEVAPTVVAEEGAAEPEVIGRKPTEEEAAAAEGAEAEKK